jgi:hypothetical protein
MLHLHIRVSLTLQVPTHNTYQEWNTTHKIRHHQIGKNHESSTDIQHETGQSDTINSSRTQANQTSISEIRYLLSQCNSYIENVNRLIITVYTSRIA